MGVGCSEVIEMMNKDSSYFANSLHTDGGFCWWYADLVDQQGNGCVLVWSFGLPFLPGSRKKQAGWRRPSVHFALYESGRAKLYLLNQHSPEKADIAPASGSGSIGASRFLLEEVAGRLKMHAQLHELIDSSGEELEVDLRIEGPALDLPNAGANLEQSAHVWAPRSLTASGKVEIQTHDYSCSLEGSAYVDSNASDTPLHEQGLLDWRWGRITFPYGTYVYYDVTSEQGERQARVLFAQPEQFRCRDIAVSFRDFRRSSYGLNTPRTVILGGERTVLARHSSVVDDGPFYQRYLVEALDERGVKGRGVAEYVAPSKVDVPWQRPFVRMRTHRVHGSNSFFLPLFSGLNGTGARRLLNQALWGAY